MLCPCVCPVYTSQTGTGSLLVSGKEILNFCISDCGLKGSGRIVNGTEAGENEFPWMCSVNYNDNSVGV